MFALLARQFGAPRVTHLVDPCAKPLQRPVLYVQPGPERRLPGRRLEQRGSVDMTVKRLLVAAPGIQPQKPILAEIQRLVPDSLEFEHAKSSIISNQSRRRPPLPARQTRRCVQHECGKHRICLPVSQCVEAERHREKRGIKKSSGSIGTEMLALKAPNPGCQKNRNAETPQDIAHRHGH